MKKAIWITLGVLILVPALLLGGFYLTIRYHYQDTFMPGVFINGFYAADYTPEELNEELKKDTQCPDFTVKDKDGNVYTFSLAEIQYDQDYYAQIKKIQSSQSVFDFVKWFTGEEITFDEIEIMPETSYDSTVLHTYLDSVKYLEYFAVCSRYG